MRAAVVLAFLGATAQAGPPACFGPAVSTDPPSSANATVPDEAVIHLYYGDGWAHDAKLQKIRATQDSRWEQILSPIGSGGSLFYSALGQYGGSGGMNGYWAGSYQFSSTPKFSETPTPKIVSGADMKHVTTTEIENEIVHDWKQIVTNNGLYQPGTTPAFVVYLPPGVLTAEFFECKDPQTTCKGGTCCASCQSCAYKGDWGYHGQSQSGTFFVVSVIGNSYSDLVKQVLNVTDNDSHTPSFDGVESHELVEAATNSNHKGWHCPGSSGSGMEICDACEPWTYPAWWVDDKIKLSQFWSNSADPNGACGPCGGQVGQSQPCCGPKHVCNPNFACVMGSGDVTSVGTCECGTVGLPCCGGKSCDSGLACNGDVCTSCGGEGKACCPDAKCGAGLACNHLSGICGKGGPTSDCESCQTNLKLCQKGCALTPNTQAICDCDCLTTAADCAQMFSCSLGVNFPVCNQQIGVPQSLP